MASQGRPVTESSSKYPGKQESSDLQKASEREPWEIEEVATSENPDSGETEGV